MNYKHLSIRVSTVFCAAFVFAAEVISVHAGDVVVVSPDKQWEYQVNDEGNSKIIESHRTSKEEAKVEAAKDPEGE
jgi:hypothetical protein